MTTTKGRAPGFVNHPEHVVHISPNDRRWVARHKHSVLADSRRAIVLEETGYERVVYFPPKDVAVRQLRPIDRRTTCPFKGEAHYFVQVDSETDQPVAWTYPAVYDEVADIQGYIAFYEDQVELCEESAEK